MHILTQCTFDMPDKLPHQSIQHLDNTNNVTKNHCDQENFQGDGCGNYLYVFCCPFKITEH